MKRSIHLIIPIVLLIIIAGAFNYLHDEVFLTEREKYERFLKNHPYKQREKKNPEELKKIPKKDRPDLAWEQDFIKTLDPALGYPPVERSFTAHKIVDWQKSSRTAISGLNWTERGPSNVGGRTRAIMFDPNDGTNQKVWAGGVTGGLWYNNDITNSSSAWTNVDDFWETLSVICMDYDPNNTQTFYVGTGEGWTASGNYPGSSTRGAGIWKTTDGGTNWSQLSATSGYYYVLDVAVRDESGSSVIYAAVDARYYNGTWHGSQGLYRSTDGGSSFSQVLPNVNGNPYTPSDIEIGADNRIYVGTKDNPYGDGGGTILYSDNGTSWTTVSTYSGVSGVGRVELACAPSNSNVLYAVIEANNQVYAVAKSTSKGSSWSNMSEPNDDDGGISAGDFSRGQAWYDLIIAVDPNDANTVFTGAIDLFKSTDGASSWTQISHWYGGFGYPEVHADQHQIVFSPGSSSEIVFGNDGGVYYTSTGTSSTPSFTNMNNNYNVTQFYACAIHPTAGTDYFLAGAQDNGSQQFNSSGIDATTEVTGGDGAYCFIDQTDPTYQITSYVYNSYRLSTNGGSFFSDITNDQSTGEFINPADYDDQEDILFSARTSTSINRIMDITGSYYVDDFSISLGAQASHIRVSPYASSGTSTIFVGTESGRLFKVTGAHSASPSATEITGSSFPTGNISCIEIGASENELLVTFSNYGVTSIWYSADGGSSWTGKEGNLPDIPVRWALFNPNDRNQVMLATEVGVWSTTDISISSPDWDASNSGLANVRVDMLQMRDSDNEVIAATHGRGLFSTGAFNSNLPTADFTADQTTGCPGLSVNFTDNSSGSPTSWQWSFPGGSPSSSTSQNPSVTYSGTGSYDVTLIVDNGNGSDTTTMTNYISTSGLSTPFTENFDGFTTGDGTASGDPGVLNNGWNNDTINDDIQWNVYTGSTTSTGTGPSGDHTSGSGNYMYIESSSPNNPSYAAYLISPCIDLSGVTTPALVFWYHMYGSNMGELHVDVYSGGTWNNDVMTAITGDQGDVWLTDTIDLSAFSGNIKLRFRGITGSSYTSDIAIDDVGIIEYSNPPSADFTADNTNICAGMSVDFTDMSSSSSTSWSWTFSGGTPNSSAAQNPTVTYNTPGTYDVTLTATNSNGSDTETKTGYITVGTPVSSFPYSENFDGFTIGDGLAGGDPGVLNNGWYNDTISDDIQWKVHTGSTVSTATGPSGDHTSGTGNYMYIEASTPNNPYLSAYLISPCIDISSLSRPFVSFWYHMYGTSMGELHLDVYSGGSWNNDVMTMKSGDQGNAWYTDSIDLSSYSGTIRLRFRGITGSGFESDIAIDDVSIFDNPLSCTPDSSAISQGFENAAFQPTDWLIQNDDADATWQRSTSAGGFGNSSASAYFDNYSNDLRGTFDVLFTPLIDLSGYLAPQLSFDIAYAQYNGTLADTFIVYYSDDCDNSWNLIYFGYGSNLSTTGTDESTPFVPAANQWRNENMNLSSVLSGSSVVRFAFINISGYGNNLYLDNINVNDFTCSLTASATATDDTCASGSGTATANAAGAAGSVSYLWSTGASTQTVTGLSAGNYIVTISDTMGCTASDTVTVNEIIGPTTSITGSDVSCAGGNDGSADLTVSDGTTPYSYLWSNGEITEDISNLSAGSYSVIVTDLYGCTANDTVTIDEPPALIISATAGVSDTCNAGVGTASASASGGTGFFVYNWSDGQTGNSVSGLSAGTHMVTVTDQNGCTATDTITISNYNNSLSLSVSTTDANCGSSDGDATVTPSGGASPYSFLWSDGQTTQTANNLSAGTYSVIVTDFYGCTDSTTATVNNTGAPALTTSVTDISCNGDTDGAIDLTISGGSGNFTYSWSNGSITEDISNLSAGIYTVSVTDNNNGCIASTSDTISEPLPLNLITNTNDAICGLSDGAASVNVSGGTSPYDYLWSDGQTTATATGLASGTYTVTITDFNSCTSMDSVTISETNQISLSVSVTDVQCNGNDDGAIDLIVSGGSGNYNYAWSDGSISEDLNNKGPGTYSVTVTDDNGCADSISATITEPAVISLTTSMNDATCGNADGTANVSATGGAGSFSYNWSDGQTGTTASGLSAGNYSVIVTDVNNCSDTAYVTINNIGAPSLSLTTSEVSCFGGSDGSINVNVSGGSSPYTFLWSDGQTTQEATGLSAGSYSVTVEDDQGCISITDTVITEPDSALSLSAVSDSSTNGSNGSIDLTCTGGTSPYTYSWSNGETTEDISGLAAGTYTVVVTDNNDCVDSLSVEIFGETGISALLRDPLKLYPNPTYGEVIISAAFNNNVDVDITIYDMIGSVVSYKKKVNEKELYERVDLSEFERGIYLFKVEYNNNVFIEKVVLID